MKPLLVIRWKTCWLVLAACVSVAAGAAPADPVAAGAGDATPRVVRVWPRRLNPREYPDDTRRAVKPPSWETFRNLPQFTCLRGFEVNDRTIVGFAAELDKYARHDLGSVIWPAYPILFADNLGALAEEIRRRGLYLFDIWGYVPGSGPGGYWQQFQPPASAFAVLEEKLGERWLGTDIGEQDGRYIGGYADQMTPASASRFEQYANFQQHFERMGNDLGNRHSTLVSLNYGHYLLKEGTYTLIGAETAQALPNNQVYYAFIRGAGKQYGVPWFGNASIYNRWGFKNYASAGTSEGTAFGPTKGSSASLMKRLLYSHLLYNSVAAGFENGWFAAGDQLSPLGRIQQSAQRWIRQQGQPGVMHTPVALLFDFYAGWTFPRHLYTDKLYRVWGNLPYEKGDYWADAVLDMLYPGYQDSSYFHDESGFIAPTPYGDIADCLLSDTPGWVLSRYPVVVMVGDHRGGRELRDKLQGYLGAGGRLVIMEEALARLPGGLRSPDPNGATPAGDPGQLIVLTNPLQSETDAGRAMRSEVDRHLPKPYSLAAAARAQLDAVFRQQALFDVGNPGLAYITCRQGAGEYTLGVLNNSWKELPLRIASRVGPIEALREILPGDAEKESIGYTPEGVDASAIGLNSATSIAGGEVRIFSLKVREQGVRETISGKAAVRPRGRVLPLRHITSIQREILARPTFFEHFDGVVVDWRYVGEREESALRKEAGWLRRQGVKIYVDLSSGLNLYPHLRLIDNADADYQASLGIITNVIGKMPALGAHDLLLSLHRHPENNFSDAQTREAFAKTLRGLAAEAAPRQVTLHLRMTFGKPPGHLEEALALLDRVGATNLLLAPATASLAGSDYQRIPKNRLGLWLVADARKDLAGVIWDTHAPWHQGANTGKAPGWHRWAPQAPIVFDAVYASQDEEYLDAVAFEL